MSGGNLTASNTYTGGWFHFGTGGTTINGGTLQMGGATGTLVKAGSGSLVLCGTNTYAGGTFNLTASNTYTGGTTIDTGQIEATNGTWSIGTENLGGGVVSDALWSKLDTGCGGTTVQGGTLIVISNGSITDGTSLTIGNQSVFPVTASIVTPASASGIPDGGNLTVGTESSSFFNEPVSTLPTVHVLSPVPEPGTLALFAIAGAMLICPRPWRLFVRSGR
jgi:autotransporter-associated beta strand protein